MQVCNKRTFDENRKPTAFRKHPRNTKLPQKILIFDALCTGFCPACSLIADDLCLHLSKEFFFWRLTSCPAAA